MLKTKSNSGAGAPLPTGYISMCGLISLIDGMSYGDPNTAIIAHRDLGLPCNQPLESMDIIHIAHKIYTNTGNLFFVLVYERIDDIICLIAQTINCIYSPEMKIIQILRTPGHFECIINQSKPILPPLNLFIDYEGNIRRSNCEVNNNMDYELSMAIAMSASITKKNSNTGTGTDTEENFELAMAMAMSLSLMS